MLDKASCLEAVDKFYKLPPTDCSTAEGREIVLAKMQAINDMFYQLAVQTGCHPFIEFCGILNEYLKICRDLHQQGIDFSEINVHTGQKIHIPGHRLSYIQEKLECIFSGFETRDVFQNVKGAQQHD